MKTKLLSVTIAIVLGFYYSKFFCHNGIIMATVSALLFVFIGIFVSKILTYGSEVCRQEDESQMKESDEL